jgi:glutamyl-tRNA synthetase
VARHGKGDFVLRIEDTDQKRFVDGAERVVLETLQWLGLDWDEGPELDGSEKGAYGPYHQTARKENYLKWAQVLIGKGLAYADPYTPEQVEQFRAEAKAAKKAFLYRDYRPENPPEWDGSRPLRFKVPELKRYEWDDAVMGHLSAGPEALDDFILIKSDGLPTYNFAHVVDDHEMKITHVIRGQEYIASMPKYLSLYDALEFERPVFACEAHIMAPDGNKKLGKRDGAKSVTEYRDAGYLPEAMLNFLASLGWNDGTEQEIFSKEELIEKFTLERVQKSGARFDEKRLVWMNGQWIKQLELDDLYERVHGFWGPAGQKASAAGQKAVLAVVQDRLKTLADLPSLTEYFFTEPKPNWQMVDSNKQLSKLPRTEHTKLLEQATHALEAADFNSEEALQSALNELLAETGQKPPVLFGLVRFALTWAQFSPGLPETMHLLGRERTLARLQVAIDKA